MRIKHTDYESFKVCYSLPGKKWYFYKFYSSKQSALSAIKRLKNKEYYDSYIYKIDWCPRPFASDDECVNVYNEDDTHDNL